MHVTLEEIDNNIACLVPDSADKPIYMHKKKLPQPYEIGDVFIVRNATDDQIYLEKDEEEKEKRLMLNRLKREALLKRSNSKERKSDS